MDDSKLGEAVRPYVERKMLGKKITPSFCSIDFSKQGTSEGLKVVASFAGCPVPIFSYFFLFFEPLPIFSYFLTKTSYFSYFLAGEANICNKIENGIIVVYVLE